MRTPKAARGTLAALVLVLAAVASQGRAADAPPDPRALLERITRNVSAGLAGAPEKSDSIVPAPHVGLHAGAKPAPVHASANPAAPADTTPDGVWNDLVAGNRRFVADRPRPRPLGRERGELVAGQHPRAVVLGCSDSRVSPELVFDQSLGDLFVVRTAGNIVDPIALGSIEYAVEHLHARLLVVLGHGACGAVRAAAEGGEMPSTHLQAIVDRIRPTVQRLSACFEGEELVERSVVANARQSAADVVANSAILRDAIAHGELRVISAVYDLGDGTVTAVSAPGATAQSQAPPR